MLGLGVSKRNDRAFVASPHSRCDRPRKVSDEGSSFMSTPAASSASTATAPASMFFGLATIIHASRDSGPASWKSTATSTSSAFSNCTTANAIRSVSVPSARPG